MGVFSFKLTQSGAGKDRNRGEARRNKLRGEIEEYYKGVEKNKRLRRKEE